MMTGKKIEKNNVSTALTFLYAKNEKMCTAYISKQNSNHSFDYQKKLK